MSRLLGEKVRPSVFDDARVTVAITGLIGVGKSTSSLLSSNEFERRFGLKTSWVKEPVDHWKKLGMLERFYEHQKERSLEFQVCTWSSRLSEFANIPKDAQVVFCDGHMVFDRAFMGSLHEQGKFTDQERDIYMYLWKSALGMVEGKKPIIPNIEPDVIIYLGDPSEFDDTEEQSPCVDMCLDRIRERGRKEEIKSVDRKYLHHLKKHYHKILFDDKDEFVSRWDVRFVDANRPEGAIIEDILSIANEKRQHMERARDERNKRMVKDATKKFMQLRNGDRVWLESEKVVTEMMEIMRSIV